MDRLVKCFRGVITYADLKDCRIFPRKLQCTSAMKDYVKCMESNAGRKPDPFEPEYCEEERQLYKLCRDDLRGPTDEDDSD